jgi:hypothetical protein
MFVLNGGDVEQDSLSVFDWTAVRHIDQQRSRGVDLEIHLLRVEFLPEFIDRFDRVPRESRLRGRRPGAK